MSNTKTQLIVIGAGPGGYTAAFLAADLGVEVTLVDINNELGGVCLSRGCIPSKALLHAAKVLSDAREAKEFGIDFADPKIDIDKIRGWKNGIVSKLTGGLKLLCKQRKINFIQGRAAFVDSNTIKIKENGGQEQTISFDNAIIATGSYPVALPSTPTSSCIINSTQALDLESIPENLLIIGGGYIGLELGTVYSELGSKVSVVEMTDGLLPGCDRDLVSFLQKRLTNKFEAIKLSTKVLKIDKSEQCLSVTFEDKNGEKTIESFKRILVCIGRKPRPQALGLENTKVECDDRGFVKVNSKRQTADSHIYAIGDVTAGPMLAHKASAEGRVAAKTIAGHDVVFAPKAIPCAIFTDPEIAWCGITETTAKDKDIPVKIEKFPWAASGRAMTLNRTDGMTKLIIDPNTERILGIGIVGVGAGELIDEGVLAIEREATVSDMESIIHPHPTLSETIMESAEMFFGRSTHLYRPKKS